MFKFISCFANKFYFILKGTDLFAGMHFSLVQLQKFAQRAVNPLWIRNFERASNQHQSQA